MTRFFILIGAVMGLTAVALAAAAAHALPARLDAVRLHMVESAIQMQGWHALALVMTGLWVGRGGRFAVYAGAAFAAGLLLFCGAVYTLAFTGVRLGPTAPIGGLMLMLGWALLGVSALTH